MKKFTILIAMMLGFTLSASAYRNCDGDWKEKMMSEKIAFLTVEMGITPEEAQTFWPVYNEVCKEKDAAMHDVFKTFKELKAATEAGKPDQEISKLLDNYLKALEVQRNLDEKAAEKFSKALPVDKLAKLYVGEEKFRRQHIRKMKGHPERKPEPKR